MFLFRDEPTEEERKGNLSYKEAINRPNKNSQYHLITTVSWEDCLDINWETIYVKSLNKEYTLAIEPKLPNGYEMNPHDSWVKLQQDFLEAIKEEESPEKQHELFQEMETFVDKYGEFRFASLVKMKFKIYNCYNKS